MSMDCTHCINDFFILFTEELLVHWATDIYESDDKKEMK